MSASTSIPEARLPVKRAWLVFAVALVAQAWTLGLTFQLDDYLLLRDPLALFAEQPSDHALEVPRFMLRWTLWLLYAGVAAISPEPLSPFVFHAVSLVLHAVASVLLARCVARLFGARDGARIGLIAGLAFATAAGPIQAVSWPAAWSDLLLVLFGLGTLEAFLAARVSSRRASAWRIAGLFGCYLLMVTKAPGVIVVASIGAILACLELPALLHTALARRNALHRLVPEVAALAVAIGAGLLSRKLYLGTLSMRYFDRQAPGSSELLGLLPDGLRGLGQSVYPWNRSPLFDGDEPLLARLFGQALGGPELAFWLVGSFLALAFFVLRGRRLQLAATFLVLLACVVPLAIIHDPQPLNLSARVAYLPWTALACLWALSLVGLWRAAWRRAAALMLVCGVAVQLDGWWHVRATETLQAEEQAALRAAVDEVCATSAPGAEPLILVCLPDPGFAGIPSLGDLAPAAFRPPFTEAPGTELRSFASYEELLAEVARGTFQERDLAVIGPPRNAEGLAPRAARRPVVVAPLQSGWREPAEALELQRVAGPDDASEWNARAPVPRHAFVCVEARFAQPAVGAFHFVGSGGESAPAGPGVELVLDAERPGQTWVVRRSASFDSLFGPPFAHVEWRGSGRPVSMLLHAGLPRLVIESPAPDVTLDLGGPTAAGLTVTGSVEGPWQGAHDVRLVLAFPLVTGVLRIAADATFEPTPTGWQARFEQVHLELRSPPGQPGLPWTRFVTDEVLPRLLETGLERTPVDLRLTGYAPGGAPCSESDPLRIWFTRP